MVCSKVSDPTHYILFTVSNCCLMPNEQFFRYMMARTSYIRYHEMIMMSALYKTYTLNSWIFIVLAHWNNNPRVTCHFTWTHYPDSKPTSLCSSSLTLQQIPMFCLFVSTLKYWADLPYYGKKIVIFIELCMKEDPFVWLKGNNSYKKV